MRGNVRHKNEREGRKETKRRKRDRSGLRWEEMTRTHLKMR